MPKKLIEVALPLEAAKAEILTAFNKPTSFILAIVEVDGKTTQTTYLKRPFRALPDLVAASVNYNIGDLTRGAEVVYKCETRRE